MNLNNKYLYFHYYDKIWKYVQKNRIAMTISGAKLWNARCPALGAAAWVSEPTEQAQKK